MKHDTRRVQMVWLLGLTALSLVPIYILIGWQTGGHGPDTVIQVFWVIEAGAWGLRALVEAWALVYLFQTVADSARANKILIAFEVALISLVALTVGLVIIANGNRLAIANGLPAPLYWFWSFGVAAFAPLMMGSVGFAYKVHQPVVTIQPIADTTQKDIAKLRSQLGEVIQRLETTHNPVVSRRNAIREALQGDNPPTHKALAQLHGVSVGTIGNDVKALNGSLVK
jgi:hypothetical protein